MLAAIGDVWVITRENNAPAIERALQDVPERAAMNFVYVDLPERLRSWKHGQRGVRLYYLLWQLAAARRAQALAHEMHADLFWHLTLANAWVGSAAALSRVPFVYGPVGGGVGTSWRMLVGGGVGAIAYEAGRTIARTLGRHVNPLALLAFSRAALILVQNEDTKRWLSPRHRSKTVVFPNVVIREAGMAGGSPAPAERDSSGPSTALFAGRLIHWKGAHLAIAAVALTPRWRLIISGEGRDEQRLRDLAEKLGCSDRVDFIGWTSRAQLFEILERDVDVLLFPSLHDEAGWIVAEALARGVPVVCCDRGGPPAIANGAAVTVTPTTPHETVVRLAAALADGHIPTRSAARRRGQDFSPEARTAALRHLLGGVGLVGTTRV